jgi:integrase
VILGSVSEISRKQAGKAAEEYVRPLNLGKFTPLSTLTFQEFVERYFIPNALPTLKLSTQKRYRQTLTAHLLPAFGPARLCDIRNIEVQQFVLQKLSSGLGWACCDHFRNLMAKVFKSARKWGYYSGENPALDIDLPEKTPVREKHVLTYEQISRLLEITEEPYRTMLLLAVITGFRVGEILGLRWKNVDFEANEIRVEESLYRGSVGSPKTKGSKRVVPMSKTLRARLLTLWEESAERSTEQFVFHTRTGKPFSDTNLLHRVLKPTGAKIGAGWLNWHTLRRTHCTLFQDAGGSLRDAQAQLGHTKMSTTLELYTIPIDGRRRDTVEKLDELVTNGDELAWAALNRPMPTEQIQ